MLTLFNESVAYGRREIIGRLGALFGAFELFQSAAAPAEPQERSSDSSHPDYPIASYIPPGYSLHATQWAPPEGFGGGADERSLIYSKPGFDPVTQLNFPVKVIITTVVTRRFGTIRDSKPTPIELHMKSGETLPADYYDGWWVKDPNGEVVVPPKPFVDSGGRTVISPEQRVHWDTSDVNSLLFQYLNYHVGITGSRRRGISLEELIRISESLH